MYKENNMKREEEIRKRAEYIANGIMIAVQANKYHTNVYDYKKECFNHSHLMDAAIGAANWADEHPRKGLVDIDDICEYLTKNDKGFILTEMSIAELRKAMEGE